MSFRKQIPLLSDPGSDDDEPAPRPPRPPKARRRSRRPLAPRVSMELSEPQFGAPVDDAFDGKYGKWRMVPGFAAEKLMVSDQGWVRVGRKWGWMQPSLGCLTRHGYRKVTVDRRPYMVHVLVCRAFNGPCPEGHTCDHINHEGPKDDNRASNLRWATPSDQIKNQKTHRPRSSGQPILVRHRDWPEEREWAEYASALAAEKALDVNNLCAAARKRAEDGTVWYNGGYEAKWAPPREPQGDLPPETDEPPPPREEREGGVNYLDDQPERWEPSLRFPEKLWVSTRGRVQSKNTRGDGWGHRHTPTPGYCVVYPKACGVRLHILAFETFVCRVVRPNTVDHINRDTTDARLVNLRIATRSEQAANRTYKPASEINDSRKTPVEARPLGSEDAWEWFESVREAVRALGARFPGTKFHPGPVSGVVRGRCSQHAGYEFRAAERKREEE